MGAGFPGSPRVRGNDSPLPSWDIAKGVGGAVGAAALGVVKDVVVRRFQARAETRRGVGIEEKTTVEIYGPDNKTVVSVVEVEAGKSPKIKR
jgi:hypothetical protein